jgi:hypothetical protein
VTRLALLALLLAACSGQVETLPEGCAYQTEFVRKQLCPTRPYGIGCRDVASTNPAPDHCEGLPQSLGFQETGNDWCCW